MKSDYKTAGCFCRSLLSLSFKNSENIFSTGRDDGETAIFYVFLISQTDLEGNLKMNGKPEQSHAGYCVSSGRTQSNQGALRG